VEKDVKDARRFWDVTARAIWRKKSLSNYDGVTKACSLGEGEGKQHKKRKVV